VLSVAGALARLSAAAYSLYSVVGSLTALLNKSKVKNVDMFFTFSLNDIGGIIGLEHFRSENTR